MSQILPLVFLLLLCSISSLSVSAQSRWIAVASSGSKIYYIDENLTKQPNGNILGWERGDLPDNRIYPLGSYFVTRSEWNCRNRTNRQIQTFIYDRFDNFIETIEIDTSWKDNPPDSVGEKIINRVCGVKKKSNLSISQGQSSGSSFAEIIKKSNLMAEANPRSEILRKVAVGEKLVLISEESTGVWYRVLDPKTNSEGWLNGNHFKIIKARKNAKGGRQAGKSN